MIQNTSQCSLWLYVVQWIYKHVTHRSRRWTLCRVDKHIVGSPCWKSTICPYSHSRLHSRALQRNTQDHLQFQLCGFKHYYPVPSLSYLCWYKATILLCYYLHLKFLLSELTFQVAVVSSDLYTHLISSGNRGTCLWGSCQDLEMLARVTHTICSCRTTLLSDKNWPKEGMESYRYSTSFCKS